MRNTLLAVPAACLAAGVVMAQGNPGWRGDGTGRYPNADPPVHWGRVAKSVRQLRSQATRPKEGETGKPIPDGVIREWLILGPVPIPDALKKLDKDILPDEATLEPSEGEKIGDLAWRKFSPDSQTLDFRALLGVEKQTQAVAYACAYIYVESAQTNHMNAMSSGHRLLVNGVPPKEQLVLQKGWNRLLFRVQSGKPAEWGSGPEPLWYLRSILYGAPKCEFDATNMAWSTGLPGAGISTPIIVGDKIFVTAEHRSLCCLNKSDGQLLWMRTITLYDVATDEEKKATPDVFQEIAPLAAKLSDIDRSIKPGAPVSPDLASKQSIEDNIIKLMAKVDRKKYAIYPPGEGGVSTPTPTSDGQNVYVTFLPYLVACFDMDGNPRWVTMHEMNPPYNGSESHGMFNSPVLLDGKLIVSSDRVFALDTKTGKLVWQNPPTNGVGTASLLAMACGKEPLLVTPMTIYRARDGTPVSSSKGDTYYGCMGTPVIADGRIFRLFARGGTPGTTVTDTIRVLPSPSEPFKSELMKGIVLDANRFPRWYGGWSTASPLYHEGLLYCLSEDGVLSVVETEKQEVVYQKMLDLDLEMTHVGNPSRGGACASPALAGKYIYIFGNHGTCVVIEPGRSFRQVARNRVESGGYPDIIASCPVFEGKRLYYRAYWGGLHCIQEN